MMMHSSCPSALLLGWILLLCPALVSCATANPPILQYPLQAQRPPVARVNQTFSWTLLPDTFTSVGGSALTLSSRSLPPWAAFDAASYTFAGIPGQGDIGSYAVTVQANVSGVATGYTDTFTLLVVDESAPYVKLSIAAQLPSASSLGDGAKLTANGALQIPPQWSFSLGFQQYTFEQAAKPRIYYTAYLAGTTSLPTWLNFDNTTVTFDGVVPATNGMYTIEIFGSDFYGYGDLTQTFQISVGWHSFEIVGSLPAINATTSQPVSYQIMSSNVQLDGVAISNNNLSSVLADVSTAPYLTYNGTTHVISGVIPSNATTPSTLVFPVTFVSQYNNTALGNVTLRILPPLFTTTIIPTLVLVTGQSFKQDLSIYVNAPKSRRSLRSRAPGIVYIAGITPIAAQQWISFDPSTLILSGTVPPSLPSYGNPTVTLTATDMTTGISSQANLPLSLSAAVKGSALPTTSTTSGTPSMTSVVKAGGGGLSEKKKLAIGLSLGLIFGLPLLIILLLLLWKRYREDDRSLYDHNSGLIFNVHTMNTPSTAVGTPDLREKIEKTAEEQAAWRVGEPVDHPDNHRYSAGYMGQVQLAPPVPIPEAETSKPRRLGLMGFLKGNSKKEVSSISIPTLQSSSLYGLGMGARGNNPQHNIVVVTDENSTSYVPQAQDYTSETALAEGESDLDRSSTWESGGSSSLFYSGGSGDEGRRTRRTPREPPSAPRQRRDFLPVPAIRQQSPTPSPSGASSPPAGIRLVGSISNDSRFNSDSSNSASQSNSNGSRGMMTTQEFSSSSLDSAPSPQMIAFTNERQTQHQPNMGQYSSQTALRDGEHAMRDSSLRDSSLRDSSLRDSSVHDSWMRDSSIGNHDLTSSSLRYRDSSVNSMVEDADEGGNTNRRSALYRPSHVTGSPTTSAVFYPSGPPREASAVYFASGVPSEATQGLRSPSISDSGVRLIGNLTSSPYLSHEMPERVSSLQQHKSIDGRPIEQVQFAIQKDTAFRFTPQISPTSPQVGSYSAVMDTPEHPQTHLQPLPEWLHFDPNTLELSGIATGEQGVGTRLRLVIMKQSASESPESSQRQVPTTVGASNFSMDHVVARYEIVVGNDSGDNDQGELQMITY